VSERSILIVEDEAIMGADLAGKLRHLSCAVAGIAAGYEDALAPVGRSPSATKPSSFKTTNSWKAPSLIPPPI
jgi:hypothetical protein